MSTAHANQSKYELAHLLVNCLLLNCVRTTYHKAPFVDAPISLANENVTVTLLLTLTVTSVTVEARARHRRLGPYTLAHTKTARLMTSFTTLLLVGLGTFYATYLVTIFDSQSSW